MKRWFLYYWYIFCVVTIGLVILIPYLLRNLFEQMAIFIDWCVVDRSLSILLAKYLDNLEMKVRGK
jgi:hypothetical protein